MAWRDDAIMEEVERLTLLVSWVALTLAEQDGRLMALESTRYQRLVAIGVGSGVLGALLGALLVWGVVHVG